MNKHLHVIIKHKRNGKYEWSIRSKPWGESGAAVYAQGWLFDLETVRFIAWMNLHTLTKGSGQPNYACGECYTWAEIGEENER